MHTHTHTHTHSACCCAVIAACPVNAAQVRLPLMSTEFLFDHVYKNPLVTTDKECCDMFVNSLRFKCFESTSSSLLPQVTPRRPPTTTMPVRKWEGSVGCSVCVCVIPYAL